MTVKVAKQMDQITSEIPPEEEMVIYLDGHWKLLDDLLGRVDSLRNLLLERKQRYSLNGYVVESDEEEDV